MIGAIIGVFSTVMSSDSTKAWQLYSGVFFILIVMYAPGGMASIIMMNLRVAKFGMFKRVWPSMWKSVSAAAVTTAGAISAVEMS
ncbi:hypothetical protein OY671_010733 [Metschnikowia pulcherrima]|nr:hypothetical protein OY671_010733 [Metschnikowia pulcherrima]